MNPPADSIDVRAEGGMTPRVAGFVDRHPAWCALAVALLSLALKVPGIDRRGLWFDESYTVWLASHRPAEIVGLSLGDQNPPLYGLLMWGWVRLVGMSEAALRTPSVAASVATAVLLLLFARRFFDGEVAVVSSLLFAASEPQLYYAREARGYALLGLLCVASFWLYLRLLERPSWRAATALGLVNATAMYTSFTIGLAFLAQAACTPIFARRSPRGFRLYLASQFLAVAIFAPWLAPMRRNLPEAGKFWLQPPGSFEFNSVVDGLSGGPFVLKAALVGVIAVAAAAAFGFTRRPGNSGQGSGFGARTTVVAAWATFPIVLGFIVSQWIPVFNLRYQLAASLGWFLLVGVIVSRLPLGARWRFVAGLLVVAVAATRLDREKRRGADWRELSDFVVSKFNGSTSVVISPSFYCMSLAYYASPEVLGHPDRFIDELARQGVQCSDDLEALPLPGSGIDRVVLVGPEVRSLVPKLERAGFEPLVERQSAESWAGAMQRRRRFGDGVPSDGPSGG